MHFHGRSGAGSMYFIAAVVTFMVALFQLTAYYKGIALSISLFADTFHAGSDGVTLLGTSLLLFIRARTYSAREAKVHTWFTFMNIALLFVGVVLALYELYHHAGEQLPTNWAVVIVATLGGIGDFVVWRILLRVRKGDMPPSLHTNHEANLLHITQDLMQSWIVVLSGIAIRFGVPYVDTVLGTIITLIIFLEGVGLLYEEQTGKHFPYHFHLFAGAHDSHDADHHGHHH
jgi:Co/Zn/Cd efflux system component